MHSSRQSDTYSQHIHCYPRANRHTDADTHPITGDLFDLVIIADNGFPLTLQGDVVLAEAQGEAAIGLLDVGGAGGQVLALSDLGLLDLTNPGEGERDNLDFLRNLARYAHDR